MKNFIFAILFITQLSAFAQIPADYEKLFPNSFTNNELGFNKDRLKTIHLATKHIFIHPMQHDFR